jgi:hypothetical protein
VEQIGAGRLIDETPETNMTAAIPMRPAEMPIRTQPSASMPTHRHDAAAHARPLFGAIDIAGFVAATIMALGPLTAYAVGM